MRRFFSDYKGLLCSFPFSFPQHSWLKVDMSIVHTTIAVSFVSILKDICSVLNADPPVYKVAGARGDCMSVAVKVPGSRHEHVFYGVEESTLDASAEAAARRMVVFLVRMYRVLVVDVNLGLRVRNEQCAQLYGCNHDLLDRIQKGLPAASSYEVTPVEGLDYGAVRVDLDFMSLLKEVVDLFQISVTPINVLRLMNNCYVAWFSFSVPGSMSPSHGVVGFRAAMIHDAKQSLAMEAVALMAMWYRFEVQDVSYYLLWNSYHLMGAEQGMYERLRQRLYGVGSSTVPVPYVVEEGCTTPRGKRNMIPDLQNPPPSTETSSSSRFTATLGLGGSA